MKHMNKTILALFALIATNASLAGGDAYIQSDGTTDSCIITDYTVKSNTKIEFDFELTDLHDSNILFGHYSLGTENTHMRTFMLYCQKDGSKRWFRMQARDGGWINEYARATTNIQDKARHIAVIDLPKKKYAFDGVENETVKPTEATLGSAPCPLTFFARPTNESATGLSQATAAKIYGVKLWESSDNGATYELVRDYIPAISNFVYGLYDRVNKSFVTSKTSDKPTGGGTGIYDVTNPSSSDPYIQSSGSQGINTGYYVKPTTSKIEVDFAFTSAASNKFVFGTHAVGGAANTTLRCGLWRNSNGNLEPVVGGNSNGGYLTACLYNKDYSYNERYMVRFDFNDKKVTAFQNSTKVPSTAENPKPVPDSNITGKSNSETPIALFAKRNSGNTGFENGGSCKIYGFRVWENDTLVLDYIPAVRDGKAGFYDLVNNVFKSSDTSTQLSYGGTPYALPRKIKDSDGMVRADVGDYSQSGLVLHLDGKRNVGAAAEHNANALTWTDLSGFGADASLYHGTPADGSAWESDGYNFVSNTYGRLAKSLPLTSNTTIQVACDINTNKLNVSYPDLIACGGNDSYDYCQIYRMNENGYKLRFKCSSTTNTSDACVTRMDVNPWGGRYVTAIRDGSKFRLSENATSWSEKTNIKIDSIPANRPWCIAGKIGSNKNVRDNSLLAGKIRSVRVYDRALSNGEIVRNRIIDDVRYTGDITEKGMLIVTSNVAFADSTFNTVAYSYAPGMYMDASGCVFTATGPQTFDGSTYLLEGYEVKKRSGSNWVDDTPASLSLGNNAISASYTCSNTTADASRMLAWKWRNATNGVVYVGCNVSGVAPTNAGTNIIYNSSTNFVAPSSKSGYTRCGYSLETWDPVKNKWGDPVITYGATKWTCSTGASGPSYRLTWMQFKNKSSYETDGLVLHFDGIWNQGRGMPRSTTANKWVNLGSAGSSSDATLTAYPSSSTDGAWGSDGYVFLDENSSHSKFVAPFSSSLYSTNYTMQMLVDADLSKQNQNESYFFSGKWDEFAIRSVGSDKIDFRMNTNQNHWARHVFESSPGKIDYLTAIQNSTERWAAIFLGTVLPTTSPDFSTYSHPFTPYVFPSSGTAVAIGGWGGNDKQSDRWRSFGGTFKNYRYYNRVLNQEEIDRNRVIDDLRYFNKVPRKYALVVNSNVDGIPCLANQVGVYLAPEGMNVTVTSPQTASDGKVYLFRSKTIYNKNQNDDGDSWGSSELVEDIIRPAGSDTYACSDSDTSSKMVRYYWQYMGTGVVVVDSEKSGGTYGGLQIGTNIVNMSAATNVTVSGTATDSSGTYTPYGYSIETWNQSTQDWGAPTTNYNATSYAVTNKFYNGTSVRIKWLWRDVNKGVVVVDSTVPGIPAAAYNLTGSNVITSASTTFSLANTGEQTVGGKTYVPCGYIVDVWDGSKWVLENTVYGSTSWNSTVTGRDDANRRITWKWWKKNSSYETDGLVFHYDGILNQGGDKPHSYNTDTWVNLVAGGVNATLAGASEGAPPSDSTRGHWDDDGYCFEHKSVYVVPNFTFASNYTAEVALDLPATGQVNNIAYIFSYTWEWGAVRLYHANDYDRLEFNTQGNIESKRPCIENVTRENESSVRYFTAMQNFDGKWAALYTGTELPTAAPERKTIDPMSMPAKESTTIKFGGFGGGVNEFMNGKIRSFRRYSRILDREELERNRFLDELRFDGAEIPASNVLLVTADVGSGFSGEANGAGVYLAADGMAFAAPTSVTVDGVKYVFHGYTVERKSGNGWVVESVVDGERSWTCAGTSSATKRLTWRMRKLVPGYVTDGLVLHYDGIWNQGAGLPHSTNATSWVDLSAKSNNATIGKETAGNGSAWASDGYSFVCTGGSSYGYAITESAINLTNFATAQVVCNVDTNNCDGGVGKWPTLAAAAGADWFTIYYDLNEHNDFLAFKSGNGNNGKCYLAKGEWNGRYVTAIRDGGTNYVTQATDRNDGGKTSTSADIGNRNWCFGGGKDRDTRPTTSQNGLNGTINAVRVYDRALTGPEIAANRIADEIRFFGRRDTYADNGRGWVVVKSNVPGLEGFERNGAYYLGTTNYVFSAPATATVDGIDYRRVGASTYELGGNPESDLQTITWTWQVANGFDTTGGALTDYVKQDKLAIHLDGIQNVGADKAHDPYATKWVNVATNANSIKGEARFVDSMPIVDDAGRHDPWTNSLANAWFGDRYYFNGHRYAVLDQNTVSDLMIGRKVVVVVVCDVDTALLRDRWNVQNNSMGWGVSVWPYLVGTTTQPSPLQMFYHAANRMDVGDYDMLRFKVNDQNFVTNETYNLYTYPNGIPDGMIPYVGIKGWGGKYAVGLHNYHNNGNSNDGTIFEGETPKTGWWFGPGLTNDVGSMTVTVGGGNSSNGGYSRSLLVGNIKAVRIYIDEFSNADFIANRKVDDIRFHRAAPGETNVTVVARYDNATSYGSGYYNVIGTVNFEAWDATTRLGSTRRLLGYKLDDGPLVENDRTGENGKMTYTYAAGAGSGTPQRDGTAHKRLTWVWEVKGLQMLYH